MLRPQRFGVLALLLLLASAVLPLAVSALAAPNPAKPFKTKVSVPSDVRLAGTELKAGEYLVVADNGKVTLQRDGKVVAEAAAEWVDTNQKESENSVLTEGQQIQEFRFRGQKRHLVIH